MTPKITIITPTYNRAHTIERAYKSLCKQTFKDFIWVVVDDGSTDGTGEVVKKYIDEAKFPIEYTYQQNKHKFITVFNRIKLVNTPYFMVLDSDDAYTPNSLEVLYEEATTLPDEEKVISIMGNSCDANGNIHGSQYPNNGFLGSILQMRYKYKVRGDKNGMFITAPYQKLLKNFNLSYYDRKCNVPQKVFFSMYDALGYKTKFINEIVRVYYFDENDEASMSSNRLKGKNLFGIIEGYKSTINNYGKQLFEYPVTLIRNLLGYIIFSFKFNYSVTKIIKDITYFPYKILAIIFLLPAFMYSKLKG